MKISVIGTGYVGLVSGTCFAEIGHTVTCIDVIKAKIDMLHAGECPIYEPGLKELIDRNTKEERLFFSTDYTSVSDAKAIFLAVGTPSADDGRANLEYLKEAAISVAKELSEDSLVVIKSTVPVGTGKMIKELISEHTDKKFHMVNNPEFLKEGSAVDDFMRPDRVVIGHDSEVAKEVMDELYGPLVRQGNPIYSMSNASAEMTKYASNCFLATKISFINEIAKLCDLTNADIDEVRKGMTSDKRIGGHFLYPGVGYGGSCFPKDVLALIATAEDNGTKLEIVDAAHKVNDKQKTFLFDKIKKHYNGNLSGKTFAFWGVAFKPNTDDIREAPAIFMAEEILKAGGSVRFFDPVATKNFKEMMDKRGSNVTPVNDMYECLDGADALVLLTEWGQFRVPKFETIKEKLSEAVLFDGRNIYSTEQVIDDGFKYYAVGKHIK